MSMTFCLCASSTDTQGSMERTRLLLTAILLLACATSHVQGSSKLALHNVYVHDVVHSQPVSKKVMTYVIDDPNLESHLTGHHFPLNLTLPSAGIVLHREFLRILSVMQGHDHIFAEAYGPGYVSMVSWNTCFPLLPMLICSESV